MSSLDSRLSRARPRSRTRIEWSKAEQGLLADKVLDILQEAPDKNLIWHANEAQKKLGWSDGMARKITGMNQIGWLKRELVQRFLKQKHELITLRTTKTPEPPPPPPPPPKIPTPKEMLAETSVGELAKIVCDRLFSRLDELRTSIARIESKMAQRGNQSQSNGDHSAPAAPAAQLQTKSRDVPKKIIAVIGVSSEQQKKIERALGSNFKYKFYDGKATHAMVPQADYTFIMCHWSSRPWIDACRRGKAHMIQGGGMAQLIDRMKAVI